jgi:hypothetical protein
LYQDKDSRIINFDILRGFFIFLAFWQHFSYYLNVWYIYYFKENLVLDKNYQIHKMMIGFHVPVDGFSHWAAWFFTPWVSQIYLTLAAFNLAKRTQQKFQLVYFQKLKVFGLILIYFTFENFLVSPHFGESISFYPIMAWMFILSAITILYQRFGVNGIWFLIIISFIRWTIPIFPIVFGFEQWMQVNIHSGYEFDAQIEYFLTSGCMGFLLGYYYYHREWGVKREFSLMFIGFLLFINWYIFGQTFSVNFLDVFESEHDLAKTFTGSLSILGIQMMILSCFLYIEKKHKMIIKIPFLKWIGINSLKLFSLHRILFVHIFVPIMLFIVTIIDKPLINTWWICWSCSILVMATGHFINKTKIHKLILR